MNYQSWEQKVPAEITGDSLWKMEAYRLALFVADIGWHDISKLVQDKRVLSLSDQLYRAVGSISANLAEGYSYSSTKNKVRFYEYALDSARESRDWYYKARHIIPEEVVQHRLRLLTQIIRLLTTMIQQKRGHQIRESGNIYHTIPTANNKELNDLLTRIPLFETDSP